MKVWTDKSGLQEYISGNKMVAHNGISYDVPVLCDLWDIDFSDVEIVDTLVLSRLYNPQLEGGHSLKSWGERFKFPKGDHSDWSQLSDEMITYCIQDVNITERVYNHVIKELSSESTRLETKVQQIITEQIGNGWKLDKEKCHDLLAELKERKFDLEDSVHKRFIPLPTFVKDIKPKIKKDGSLSVVGLKFLGDGWVNVSGNFSRIEFPEFNLGSRQQIAKYLQYFGWKPDKKTEKGSVIVDEAVLKNVDIPEAQLIAEYMLVTKRMAQINSWLEAVQDDGRVHGNVNPIGAVTGRMTHSKPNMAQVPAVYSPYGEQCRDVWIADKGNVIVGADASGLELRCLAHYMNDEGYTDEILSGDVHSANQRAAGLDTRDQAKTFIYAFLYGAGDAKIGSIVGGSAGTGKTLKEKFLSATPALRVLRDRVEQASQRGFLHGLDRRKLRIRSQHSALNTLLQSAGAVIMKQALVTFNEWKQSHPRGSEIKYVGNIHDEIQLEVPEDIAIIVGEKLVEAMEYTTRS